MKKRELSTSEGIIVGYEDIKIIAKEIARHDFNVLITGETGVGKNLFARYIHNNSKRYAHPFSCIHCPNLQNTLFESEFFGHTKGSFTDAKADRIGSLEFAKGGTIFLDEIGDLCEERQAKLLNLIESKTYKRIGENKEWVLDIRFIFATNKILKVMMSKNIFRKDLYYRIGSYKIEIPPLRENKDNIAKILQHYWAKLCNNGDELSDKEITILCDYSFPGNIRELTGIVGNVWLKCSGNRKNNREHILEAEIQTSFCDHEHEDLAEIDDVVKLCIGRIRRGANFWEAIYEPYLKREISKSHLREILRYCLANCGYSWRNLIAYLNMQERDYKKFMNFINAQGIRLMQFKTENTNHHSNFQSR